MVVGGGVGTLVSMTPARNLILTRAGLVRPPRPVDELAQLRVDGLQLLNTVLKSAAQLPAWIQAERKWFGSVVALMQNSVTKAERLKFEHLGPLKSRDYYHAVNPDHNLELQILGRRLEILDKIIDSQTTSP